MSRKRIDESTEIIKSVVRPMSENPHDGQLAVVARQARTNLIYGALKPLVSEIFEDATAYNQAVKFCDHAADETPPESYIIKNWPPYQNNHGRNSKSFCCFVRPEFRCRIEILHQNVGSNFGKKIDFMVLNALKAPGNVVLLFDGPGFSDGEKQWAKQLAACMNRLNDTPHGRQILDDLGIQAQNYKYIFVVFSINELVSLCSNSPIS